jgi:hypothetical protein
VRHRLEVSMTQQPGADSSDASTQGQNPEVAAVEQLQGEGRPATIEEVHTVQLAATDVSAIVPPMEVVGDSAAERHNAALAEAARLIYDKMHPGILGSYDPKGVAAILEPMPDADRKKVEEMYLGVEGNSAKTPLRGDLRNLSAVEYRTLEGILDREDGKPNTAGNVMVGLETARAEGAGFVWNSDSVKGNALLRAALSTLNADSYSQVETTFQSRYGMSLETAVQQTPGISEADKRLLQFWKKGTDGRTATDVSEMARLAVASKNLPMLASVMAGTGDAYTAARTELQRDRSFQQQLDTIWGARPARGVRPQETTEQKVAHDLVREGHISLATIVTGNRDVLAGFLDNQQGTEQALQSATAQERKMFTDGRAAAELLARDPSARLTPEQETSKKYFENINVALSKFNPREREMLTDQLQHGRKTLISNLAGQHSEATMQWLFGGFGGGQTTENLMSQVERMSAQDHALLTNPATRDSYRAQLEKSLETYEPDKAVRDRIMALVDAKTAPRAGASPTFEEAQRVRRSLGEVVADNPESTEQSRRSVAEAILTMTPADAQKYKDDAAFRASVDKSLRGESTMGAADDAAVYLSSALLRQVAQTGQPAQLGPVEQFAQTLMRGTGDDNSRITEAQKLLASSPSLREHMKQLLRPLTEEGGGGGAAFEKFSAEDKALYRMFVGTFGGNMGQMALRDAVNGVQNAHWDNLRYGGSATTRMQLYGTYDHIAGLPEDQRKVRMEMMTADQRTITEKVIAQGGQPTLADRMRSFIIQDGGKHTDFAAELQKLSTDPTALKALHDEYNTKYGGNLSEQFMTRVPTADAIQYKGYLGEQTAQQQFFDRTGQVSDSGGFTLDASGLALDRTLGINQTKIAEYEVMRQKLPREVQDAISQQFSDALQNHQDSKERLADAAADAVFLTAAAASIIATWGMDAPAVAALIPRLAIAGGTARPSIQAAIRGGDLEGSDIFKQTLRGTLEGASLGIVLPGGAAVKTANALDQPVAATVERNAGRVLEGEILPPVRQAAARPVAELESPVIELTATRADDVSAVVTRPAAGTEVVAAERIIPEVVEPIKDVQAVVATQVVPDAQSVVANRVLPEVAEPIVDSQAVVATHVAPEMQNVVASRVLPEVAEPITDADVVVAARVTPDAQVVAANRVIPEAVEEVRNTEVVVANAASDATVVEANQALTVVQPITRAEAVVGRNVTEEVVADVPIIVPEAPVINRVVPEAVDDVPVLVPSKMVAEAADDVPVIVPNRVVTEVTPEAAPQVTLSNTDTVLAANADSLVPRNEVVLPIVPEKLVTTNADNAVIASTDNVVAETGDNVVVANSDSLVPRKEPIVPVEPEVVVAQATDNVVAQTSDNVVAAGDSLVPRRDPAVPLVPERLVANTDNVVVANADDAAETVVANTDNVVVANADEAAETVVAQNADTAVVANTDNVVVAKADEAAETVVASTADNSVPAAGATREAFDQLWTRMAQAASATDDLARAAIPAITTATGQVIARGSLMAAELEELRQLSEQQQSAQVVVPQTQVVPQTVTEQEQQPEPLPAVPVEPVEVQELPPIPKPTDLLIQLATVRNGEGPYQSAARILREALGKPADHKEVMALTRAIQRVFTADNNGNGDMSGLRVRTQFVTAQNFSNFLAEVKDEETRKLLQEKFSLNA